MGRPRKEGLDYYPHDTNARNDDKLKLLRAKYKNDGYAVFFILLEGITASSRGILDLSDPDMLTLWAQECGVSEELLCEIIATAARRGLFSEQAWHEYHFVENKRALRQVKEVVRHRVPPVDPSITDPSIIKTRQEGTPQESTEETPEETRKIRVGKAGKKKTKPTFSPEGKRKFLDWVYLSEAQLEELRTHFRAKNLGDADLKEAIRILDAWFENNPNMRATRVNDAKCLKGWPLQRVLELKTAQAKLQTQQTYKDTAELTQFQKVGA